MNAKMLERMHSGKGFIAALDQSGGSTPKALGLYGVEPSAWHNDEEMFDLVHAMRTRIVKAPSFTNKKILGAILFEMTMDRKVDGKYTSDYLWDVKGVVPFLKVDQGLDVEKGGVRLMKPIPDLDKLLDRAVVRHIFGTKMRSVILKADAKGVKAVAEQQFALARQIIAKGLCPIIEPEVDINIPDKKEAEVMLKAELVRLAKGLKPEEKIMFKLSLPSVPGFYDELANLPCNVRTVALSGGYSRDEANVILKKNHGMIASFSRALSEGLKAQQTDAEFDAMLAKSIESIYDASVNKI